MNDEHSNTMKNACYDNKTQIPKKQWLLKHRNTNHETHVSNHLSSMQNRCRKHKHKWQLVNEGEED